MPRKSFALALLLHSGLLALLVGTGCSNEHLVGITITPQDASVSAIGQTTQFLAMGSSSDPRAAGTNLTSTVTWSSSNTSVAAITASGLATAVGCGSTVINATDGNVVGQTNFTSSCTGSGQGNPVLTSITLSPSNPTIPQIGETTQFLALAIYTPATINNDLTHVATWASSNVGIATVDSTGLATAVGCGTTTITAEYQGIIGQVQLTVSCSTGQGLQSITVDPTSPTIPQIGQSTQFLALGTIGQGEQIDLTHTATWASSNTQVATVNSGGTATAVSCGTTTISAESQNVVGSSLLSVSCAPVVSIQLLVKKTGPTASTLISTPAGIDCGTNCAALFNEGTGLTLTAAPAPSSWTGCDQVIGNVCSLTLEPDSPGGTQRTVTANF